MPELPEVETVVTDLRPKLVGQQFREIVLAPTAFQLRLPWNRVWNSAVLAREIVAVSRRGKWIVLEFSDQACLLFHLGMTGQLTMTPLDTDKDVHCHLEFLLRNNDDGLRFRDVRRFGGAMYCASAQDRQTFLGERLGPEPWNLDSKTWHSRLVESSRSLKALLLDQTLVAGVGNIYADESLHRAKLPPTMTGRDITRSQADRLRLAIVGVLEQAISARGSTIRDYIGGSGLKGEFQNELQVYGRTGEPCITCQTTVVCMRLAGRSTHYCPRCQPVRARKKTTRSRG